MLRIDVPDIGPDRWAAIAERAGELWNGVPTTLHVMAAGAVAAESYLGQVEANRATSITEVDREAIAVRVASVNGCRYCLVAHVARSLVLGVDADEIERWRAGESAVPARRASLRLAGSVVTLRGHVSDDDLAAARAAGLTDRTIIDLVGVVAENTLGNLINNVARTPPERELVAWCRRRGVELDEA